MLLDFLNQSEYPQLLVKLEHVITVRSIFLATLVLLFYLYQALPFAMCNFNFLQSFKRILCAYSN